MILFLKQKKQNCGSLSLETVMKIIPGFIPNYFEIKCGKRWKFAPKGRNEPHICLRISWWWLESHRKKIDRIVSHFLLMIGVQSIQSVISFAAHRSSKKRLKCVSAYVLRKNWTGFSTFQINIYLIGVGNFLALIRSVMLEALFVFRAHVRVD